jgi:hypothetical protein
VINFRYHVVSLTAVFLALATGLVVGTIALNGPVAENLQTELSDIRKQNAGYRDEVNHLKEDAGRQEQFATEATPYLLGERLTGKRVLLVTTADADKDYVAGMTQLLTNAGAKVTGRIFVQESFGDPASSEQLLDVVDLSLPPGVTGLPANSNGVETAAALLAAMVLDRTPPVPADARRSVLAAYKDFITVIPEISGPAEAVVFLAGRPYVERDADRKNAALVRLAEQFDKSSRLVVAGNGVGGEGNLLAALRADAALSKTVSTVDNVATPQGLVATAMALAEQLEGRVGHYGIGAGSTALLPRPANRSGS